MLYSPFNFSGICKDTYTSAMQNMWLVWIYRAKIYFNFLCITHGPQSQEAESWHPPIWNSSQRDDLFPININTFLLINVPVQTSSHFRCIDRVPYKIFHAQKGNILANVIGLQKLTPKPHFIVSIKNTIVRGTLQLCMTQVRLQHN